MSPSCARLTGHEAAEFYRRPVPAHELVVREDRPLWQAHGKLALDGDWRARRRASSSASATADGQVRWVEHVCPPVTGEDGRFLGLRGSNRDVTEKKRVRSRSCGKALAEIERLRERLEADNTYLREQVEPEAGSEGIIGKSDVLRYVLSKRPAGGAHRRARCCCRARRASARSSWPTRSTT